MSFIIRAMPSAGKTFIARTTLPVEDTDEFFWELWDIKPSSQNAALMYNDPLRRNAMRDRIKQSIDRGNMVLTNMDLAPLGLVEVVNLGYRPDDYVAHIKLVGRQDLLDNIGEARLRDWALGYERLEAQGRSVVWLKPGQFVQDWLLSRFEPKLF